MPKRKAKDLITFKRLDLVVRYLYAKDILSDCSNADILSLYKRTVLMRTGGIEPMSEYGDSTKSCIDDYVTQFKNLIVSLQKKGFDPNYPIPICPNGYLANGAHRIAAAAALEFDVEVEHVEKGHRIDFGWFVENGFSTEDKMRILKGFVDIHPQNSAIIVVWNPSFKYAGHINAFINEELDITGEIELDFENHYIAFQNALLDIYEPNNSWTKLSQKGDETIVKKAELLACHYLSFRVIAATNQDKSKDKDIHDVMTNIKGKVRDFIDAADPHLPKNIFATIHTSSNVNECRYLSEVLLSPNNVKHLKMRLGCGYEEKFFEYCSNLKTFCKEQNIDLNDICINGNCICTVFGFKPISDVDFITKYYLRERLGNATRPVADGVDLSRRGGKLVMPNGEKINDDIIVDNCEYHFMFNGLKFANLEIYKQKRKNSRRDKDFLLLRKIDLYENLLGHFEQQRIFRERVSAELERRLAITPFWKRLINWRYYWYKILSKLTFGKKRKHYREKVQRIRKI